MIRAVVQLDADVVDRVAGHHAAHQRVLDALADRVDERLRDRSLEDLVLEDVSGARLAGIEVNLHVRVVAAAAGLACVLHLAVGRTRERFLVGDQRTADARLDAELALQAVEDDLEVQLAHAADDDVAGRLAALDAERRVFGHEPEQPLGEPLLVSLGPGRNRDRDQRLRDAHGPPLSDVTAS